MSPIKQLFIFLIIEQHAQLKQFIVSFVIEIQFATIVSNT